MINPVALSASSFGDAGATGISRPNGIHDAAGQFEGLLLEQMLKAARGDGEKGWLDSGEDQAGESMTELAEQQLAFALTAGGGLGLAKMVEQAVARKGDKSGQQSSSASPTPAK